MNSTLLASAIFLSYHAFSM